MLIAEITIREANQLKKIYTQQEIKIKAKLKTAISKGNDSKYLATLLLEIQQEIKTLNYYFGAITTKNLKKIYDNQVSEIDKQLYKSGIEANFGKPNEKAINLLAQNTNKSLNKISIVIGRQSEGFLRQVGLLHTRGIIFGSDTWKKASQEMMIDLKRRDFYSVAYKLKNGGFRNVPAKVYAEMVARTTSAEAFRMATLQRITENGGDLVVIQGQSRYPNSPCVPYQGKVLSISGKTDGYGSLENAKANGLFHPNCVHNPAWSDKNLELITK